jgi:hypothetical protein
MSCPECAPSFVVGDRVVYIGNFTELHHKNERYDPGVGTVMLVSLHRVSVLFDNYYYRSHTRSQCLRYPAYNLRLASTEDEGKPPQPPAGIGWNSIIYWQRPIRLPEVEQQY